MHKFSVAITQLWQVDLLEAAHRLIAVVLVNEVRYIDRALNLCRIEHVLAVHVQHSLVVPAHVHRHHLSMMTVTAELLISSSIVDHVNIVNVLDDAVLHVFPAR